MKPKIKYRLPRIDMSMLRRLFVRLGGHLRPHRGRLAASALSLLGVSAVTLLQPWPIKIVFDYVFFAGGGAAGTQWWARLMNWDPITITVVAAASVLGLAVLKGLLTYIHNVQSKIVGHRLVADVRLQVFSHVQRLPQSYHDYRETGELMTRMTGDISLLKDLMVSILITLTSQVLLIVGMLVVMFWIDWTLGLVTLAIVPMFIIAAFRFTGRIRSSARRQREAYGKIVASVHESIAGIAQVKGFGQEKVREKLIGKNAARDVKASVKTTKLTANYARTVEILNAVGTGLVLLLGVQRALAGLISPGDVLVFLAYVRSMYRPLQSIARQTTRIAKATSRAEKILELLEIEAEVHDAPDAVSARGLRGDIEMSNVIFSYVEGTAVLNGLSCKIPAGRTTLILGPTGAGKSTIAKLILRLYEPEDGVIRIDGRNIRDYRIRSLRKRMAPLSQEAFLFRMSIAENIAFGVKGATPDEIERAARIVGADSFIDDLPEGYDTIVGEGGATLSGGQRQRISIARAILRNSPIMIFDEPATGLDVHAEQATKEALARTRAGRTLLIVTHRLHFLELADWVIFVRDGVVGEEGSPDDLMERRGELHRFLAQTDGNTGSVASPLS